MKDLKQINESLEKIKPSRWTGLYEDFTDEESEHGVDKEDILDWLYEHDQLWEDCENHFHTDPNRLSANELESFISEHEQAWEDYASYFSIHDDLQAEGRRKNSVTLFCEYEVYERYGGGYMKRVKASGKDHLSALKKLVDNMHLYLDSEEIEDDELTFEEAIDSIQSSNGDGCDYIIKLYDEKGTAFIEGYVEDDYDDLDEDEDEYLDEAKKFDFDKINRKLHGNIKLKNESYLREDNEQKFAEMERAVNDGIKRGKNVLITALPGRGTITFLKGVLDKNGIKAVMEDGRTIGDIITEHPERLIKEFNSGDDSVLIISDIGKATPKDRAKLLQLYNGKHVLYRDKKYPLKNLRCVIALLSPDSLDSLVPAEKNRFTIVDLTSKNNSYYDELDPRDISGHIPSDEEIREYEARHKERLKRRYAQQNESLYGKPVRKKLGRIHYPGFTIGQVYQQIVDELGPEYGWYVDDDPAGSAYYVSCIYRDEDEEHPILCVRDDEILDLNRTDFYNYVWNKLEDKLHQSPKQSSSRRTRTRYRESYSDTMKVIPEVTQYFKKKGIDVTTPENKNYIKGVAEYLVMGRDAWGEYTMDQWWKDTSMNYPEDIKALYGEEDLDESFLKESLTYYNNIDKDILAALSDNEIPKAIIKGNNIKCSKSAIANLKYLLSKGQPCKLCIGSFTDKNRNTTKSVSHVWVEDKKGNKYQTGVPSNVAGVKKFKVLTLAPNDLKNLDKKVTKFIKY